MTVDRLADTVREQIALGRLLPLGGPKDAVWITERAALDALRRACAAVPGVRLGQMAAGPQEEQQEPQDGHEGHEAEGQQDQAVRHLPAAAPVGALPHQPLRIEAGFDAAAHEPLPASAARLREALFAAAAADGVGLPVEQVDLRVTGLFDGGPEPAAEGAGGPTSGTDEPSPRPLREGSVVPGPAPSHDGAAVWAAVRAVPGVLELTRELAAIRGLRVHDTRPPQEPARQVQIQLATAPGYAPLDVARRAAAAAVAAAAKGAPGPVTAAVVVTEVG